MSSQLFHVVAQSLSESGFSLAQVLRVLCLSLRSEFVCGLFGSAEGRVSAIDLCSQIVCTRALMKLLVWLARATNLVASFSPGLPSLHHVVGCYPCCAVCQSRRLR